MKREQHEAVDSPSLKSVLTKGMLGLLAGYLLLLTAFIWPTADSTRPPYFDLNNGFAKTAYWFTESGGVWGATIIAVLMLIIFITRPHIDWSRRRRELIVILIATGICGGLGSALNEHFLKEYFQRPRPNVVSLSGSAKEAASIYKLKRSQRSGWIQDALSSDQAAISLTPEIRSHWIVTTGYSFPSGHSFNSMFFATFFLLLGLRYVRKERKWLFYALVPWAIAVCYSRTILRVHTPTDISVGALQGIALGLIVFLVATRFSQVRTPASQ